MTTPSNKNPISAHRAFLYAAAAPGWGEYYSGAIRRSSITVTLLILLLTWFFIKLYSTTVILTEYFFGYLDGINPGGMPDVPYVSLGISTLGLYFIWQWAMFSSVDVAVKIRREKRLPPQFSMVWGIFFSWLCPGSGQMYTRHRTIGFFFFGFFLLTIPALIPVYVRLCHELIGLLKNSSLSAADPFAVVEIIKSLMIKVDYSFAKLSQALVKYIAIAMTIVALRDKWHVKDVSLRCFAFFAVGWLCPGSGQLLQGRDRVGWGIFAVYNVILFMIGVMVGMDAVTIEKISVLAAGSIIVQWGAMVEAPVFHVYRLKSLKKERS